MSDIGSSHDRFVAGLVADLRPVRPLGPPWQRACVWLAAALVLAFVLSRYADMPAVEHRLSASPDIWVAVVGSALTAVLAALAAFELGLPDRSPWWAALPLPGLALWLGASGLGCARAWLLPGTGDATLAETGNCLRFIVGLSVPLSLAVLLLLRRGYSLYPGLMGGMAGLAAAAASATLLVLFHPFDVTVTDLSVHAIAVVLVILASRWLGGRVLRAKARGPR